MNFPSKIFFNDINHDYRAAILKKNSLWLLPFYMAVATYCYYEKVHRTMRNAIVLHLLKSVEENVIIRSSHWKCSLRKGVFRNFVKSTGKHLCQSFFFNKVANLGRNLLEHLFYVTPLVAVSDDLSHARRNLKMFVIPNLWHVISKKGEILMIYTGQSIQEWTK